MSLIYRESLICRGSRVIVSWVTHRKLLTKSSLFLTSRKGPHKPSNRERVVPTIYTSFNFNLLAFHLVCVVFLCIFVLDHFKSVICGVASRIVCIVVATKLGVGSQDTAATWSTIKPYH